MLAWLAREGWLEVRVGVMRLGGGILHAKFGLFTDPAVTAWFSREATTKARKGFAAITKYWRSARVGQDAERDVLVSGRIRYAVVGH